MWEGAGNACEMSNTDAGERDAGVSETWRRHGRRGNADDAGDGRWALRGTTGTWAKANDDGRARKRDDAAWTEGGAQAVHAGTWARARATRARDEAETAWWRDGQGGREGAEGQGREVGEVAGAGGTWKGEATQGA
ncbi:uncharacterized protein BXZ73DRAFT_80413 [Epithele typhae]|uniref:uncharacterized protein n=1 Tax=Epithele typhae TaxID=378194 RepID=UPI002007477A|nr:uncharacterized protein BXZ73DRAFT_80413 [Epithele typhae]KAH9919203.1 hypothetical protein BXZ73DRAFT_80413 [Epithele typhae]